MHAAIGVGDCEANQLFWHEALCHAHTECSCLQSQSTLRPVMTLTFECSMFHLKVLLLMHTLMQPLLVICSAICGTALPPPGNERGAPAWQANGICTGPGTGPQPPTCCRL